MRKSSFKRRQTEQFCRLWEEGGGEEGMDHKEDKKIRVEY